MSNFEKKLKRILKCDTIRISAPLKKRKFVIIGFNKNTAADKTSYWSDGNKRIDFDFVEEHTVASGNNQKEILKSAREYVRLSKLSWFEYFEELKKK